MDTYLMRLERATRQVVLWAPHSRPSNPSHEMWSFCNTIEMSRLGQANFVSSFLPGSVFHSHLPLCNAVGSAYTWCYLAGGDGRDHLLPLPWHLSPFRPPSKTTHKTYGAVPIHYFLYLETCMYTRLFDIFRCGWMLALRSSSHMQSALGS